jgi:hypothetical protein
MVALLLVTAGAFAPLPGLGATLDFEGASGYVDQPGAFFTVDDYRFTLLDDGGEAANGFLLVNEGDGIGGAGTNLFAANFASFRMERSDNRAFHSVGFDIGGSWHHLPDRWADVVRITAFRAGGAAQELDVTLPTAAGEMAYVPFFVQDISSLVFEPIASRGTTPFSFDYTVDNIVAPIPLPGALPVFLTALGALAFAARRRRA